MIYIHIPFCRQKCSYCNFHFSTSLAQKDDLLQAIIHEIKLKNAHTQKDEIASLYFGGGTPSLLSSKDIAGLLHQIWDCYQPKPNAEITLEANPEDLTPQFLQFLKSTEINRLSIGVQSFFEEDLRLMNRSHNAMQAADSIKRAQDFGFENMSIDLIYGTPTSGLLTWKNNLQTAVDLQVPHISAYALTVEPKTALQAAIAKKIIKHPDEILQEEAFLYTSQFLSENHFEHYEISNFCKPGFYSKHNTAYWQCKQYTGFGPSAHSFDGHTTRSWNVANNTLYIKKLKENILPQEIEILSEKEQYNEMLMIGLRTIFGVDIVQLQNRFSDQVLSHFQQQITAKLDAGVLVIDNQYLKIPRKNWFLADGIASDLFLI